MTCICPQCGEDKAVREEDGELVCEECDAQEELFVNTIPTSMEDKQGKTHWREHWSTRVALELERLSEHTTSRGELEMAARRAYPGARPGDTERERASYRGWRDEVRAQLGLPAREDAVRQDGVRLLNLLGWGRLAADLDCTIENLAAWIRGEVSSYRIAVRVRRLCDANTKEAV
jgi:hypothetical protein